CNGSYDRKYKMTAGGENKVREVEMEHCNDYKYAFDISLGCYEAVVNDFATRKKTFSSPEAAVEAVTKRVGRSPDTWSKRYIYLHDKSKVRDDLNWHTAVVT